jgi:hypothetical protein
MSMSFLWNERHDEAVKLFAREGLLDQDNEDPILRRRPGGSDACGGFVLG